MKTCKISERNISYLKEQNGNYRTERSNNQNKNLTDGLNSIIVMTEDRVSEHEDKSVEFT